MNSESVSGWLNSNVKDFSIPKEFVETVKEDKLLYLSLFFPPLVLKRNKGNDLVGTHSSSKAKQIDCGSVNRNETKASVWHVISLLAKDEIINDFFVGQIFSINVLLL